MKKKTFIFFATIFAISGVMLSSCSKIEAEREGNEIRLRNENNDGGYLELLNVDSAWHRYGILVNAGTGSVSSSSEDSYRSLSAKLLIDGQDNFCFYYRDGFYDPNTYSYGELYQGNGGEISSMGPVDDLGGVKKIPDGGWSEKSAVQPGYGYVVRLKQDGKTSTSTDGQLTINEKNICRYARIYVVDWDVSTTGGIIGATIRYQDNWKIED